MTADRQTLESFNDKWDDSYSEEDSKESIEGNLAPRGKFEGLLQADTTIEVVSTESGTHPLEGKKSARCHLVVYTDAGEKHIWFDAAPYNMKAESKAGGSYIPAASANAGHLYKATKMFGKPFPEVLRFATENRLVYDIGIKKATDEYPAKNVVRGIYPVVAQEA